MLSGGWGCQLVPWQARTLCQFACACICKAPICFLIRSLPFSLFMSAPYGPWSQVLKCCGGHWRAFKLIVSFCLCRDQLAHNFWWFTAVNCCIIRNRLHAITILFPFNCRLVSNWLRLMTTGIHDNVGVLDNDNFFLLDQTDINSLNYEYIIRSWNVINKNIVYVIAIVCYHAFLFLLQMLTDKIHFQLEVVWNSCRLAVLCPV